MKPKPLEEFKESKCSHNTMLAFCRLIGTRPLDFSPPLCEHGCTWGSVVVLVAVRTAEKNYQDYVAPEVLLSIAACGGPFVSKKWVAENLNDWLTIAAWQHCVETLGWEVE